jgi:hypothetical protein
MLHRPRDRSALRRRASGWASIVAAVGIAALVLSACEPDPSSSEDGAASGTRSAEPTTSTAASPLIDDPAPAEDEANDRGAPNDPSAPSTIVDPGDIVTGGTTVSHPGGPTTEAGDIRSVDFADLTYPTSVCADIIDEPPRGGFQLRGGEVHADEDAANGPYSVALRPSRSFGDVNGDDHEDAALVLECSRGGQAVPMGWIYTLDGSGPRPLAGVTLDPDSLPITGVLDTSLTNVRISGATVMTDWDVYVDGDALCCPTKTAVVVWTWTDGGLTPGAPMLTRSPSGS